MAELTVHLCTGHAPDKEPCEPHAHKFPEQPRMDSQCERCGMLFEWYINVECP